MELRKEQYIIRTAIIALLVVLTLVYLLVYSIYYRPDTSGVATLSGSESPSVVQSASQRLVNTVEKVMAPSPTQDESPKPSPESTIVVESTNAPSVKPTSPTAISRGQSGISSNQVQSSSVTAQQKTLPDTRLTYQRTIADDIGVEYRYALTDDKDIYYLYLGSSSQDLGALLQGQGGNTFALTTQTKILANQLFGSRVVFLNLPEYANKTVLMVVTVGGERWLIQIPYDIYHESKPYLATKFS